MTALEGALYYYESEQLNVSLEAASTALQNHRSKSINSYDNRSKSKKIQQH